jgi:AmiR/NasT family two-component response regulator
MEQSERNGREPSELSEEETVVAQAVGMLLSQFQVSLDDAAEKLSAVAAERGRPVVDVAREIVERRGLRAKDTEE